MSSKDLTNRTIVETLSEVVSSITSEFSLYFPELSQTPLEFYDSLKKHTLLRLRVLSGEDVSGDLRKATIDLVRTMNVRGYGEVANAEVAYDLDFENLCNSMNENYGGDVRNLSVREFYSLFNYIKKQHRPKKGKLDKFL